MSGEMLFAYSLEEDGCIPFILTRGANQRNRLERREFLREDTTDLMGPVVVEGTLFKQQTRHGGAIWERRFISVVANVLFYYHSPSNERPIAVIPLKRCSINLPARGAQSFTPARVLQENDGYEFAIRNAEHQEVCRFKAVSPSDRDMWVEHLRLACVDVSSPDAVVTRTTFEAILAKFPINDGTGPLVVTELALPRPVTSIGPSGRQLTGGSIAPSIGTSGSAPTPPAPHSSSGFSEEDPAVDNADDFLYVMQGSGGGNGHGRSKFPSMLSVLTDPHHDSPLDVEDLTLSSGAEEGTKTKVDRANMQVETLVADASAVQQAEEQRLRQEANEYFQHLVQKRYNAQTIEVLKASTRGRTPQLIDSARSKEAANPMRLSLLLRYMIFSSTETLVEPPDELTCDFNEVPHLRGQWSNLVLTKVYERYSRISHGFRGMTSEDLAFFCTDLGLLETHVPRGDNQEPLAEYRDRLRPVALVKALPKGLGYRQDVLEKALLDRKEKESKNEVGGGDDSWAATGGGGDIFLNYTQFYHIILNMADIVYPSTRLNQSLPRADAKGRRTAQAQGVEKIIQEALVPLYAWSVANFIEGCVDPLLTDRRVALILNLYAPNLWRLFVTYGQYRHHIRATLPRVPYPEGAKCSERAQFGVPESAPFTKADCVAADPEYSIKNNEILAAVRNSKMGSDDGGGASPATLERIVFQNALDAPSGKLISEGIIMTESQVVKVFHDYGIAPNLVSKVDLRRLYKKCCGIKYTRKGVSAATIPTSPKASPRASPVKARFTSPVLPGTFASPLRSPLISSNGSAGSGLRKKKAAVVATPSPASSSYSSPTKSPRTPTTASNNDTGVSFSEFLELVAAVALEALSSSEYTRMFSTPFAKVLAMLTIWGFADLHRLQDVNLMNAETFLVDS